MLKLKIRNTEEYKMGLEVMNNSSVSICSIVRDCQDNLKKNIDRIERLRALFNSSEVIVFENDSKDKTRQILIDWQKNAQNVNIFYDDFGSLTIPPINPNHGNRYFSITRIKKMAQYRNMYIDFLNNSGSHRDFILVIDLDISNFSINGVIHSFSMHKIWDCITANGKSVSNKMRNQYHDSYALIEFGRINDIQTEKTIFSNRSKYSFLKPGLPLFPVDSAYGGLAIYKWNAFQNIKYSYFENMDNQVKSKSEHVAFHKCMKENGFNKIFINPSMTVKYRSLTLGFLFNKIKEKIFNSNGI